MKERNFMDIAFENGEFCYYFVLYTNLLRRWLCFDLIYKDRAKHRASKKKKLLVSLIGY